MTNEDQTPTVPSGDVQGALVIGSSHNNASAASGGAQAEAEAEAAAAKAAADAAAAEADAMAAAAAAAQAAAKAAAKAALVAAARAKGKAPATPAMPMLPTSQLERPEKFRGNNFKRWQQKMLFYLTALNLTRFLKESAPVLSEDDEDVQTVSAVEAWKHGDYLCRNYILCALDDTLFSVFEPKASAKELWESLERKYKVNNAGAKKFVVTDFHEYMMTDGKSVIEQVEELQLIYHRLEVEGLVINEPFQVALMIEKLPPSWKEFQNYLKHKRKAMTLEGLIERLNVEQSNRRSGRKGGGGAGNAVAKAHVVEDAVSKRKRFDSGVGASLKKKFMGDCFVCNKPGHRAADCKMRTDKPKPPPKRKFQGKGRKRAPAQANVAEGGDDAGQDYMHLSAVVSEVNLVGSNPKEWWLDTGATSHICASKWMFKTYTAVDNESCFMGNSATSRVEGKGTVLLKMTSGKELTLNGVLHVPEIRKNLVSGSVMVNKGFKLVFESAKIVITLNGMYVGRGYMTNGMFKLNVGTPAPKAESAIEGTKAEASTKNNVIVNVAQVANKTSFAYSCDSFNLWHGRLGHVNANSMKKLISLNLLPNFVFDKQHKCEVCVEAKLTKSSYQHIERSTEPLGLIHTDVCDLKFIQTRGGKKYFITFIDDCTRYCYVYLMRSKDEAVEKFALYKTEVENQLNKKIKILRSDRGGEYEAPFAQICAENGIIHQTTAPYSPEQNGVAERKNRTLKEMMNAMLISSGLPQNMWGEALLSANYVLNKLPHKKRDKPPYELWKGHRPSYKFLRVWGCLAKVLVSLPKRTRIGPKTVDCVFIGYAQNSSAYRFLVHKSDNPDVHADTIIEAREASFFEEIFPRKSSVTVETEESNSEENVGASEPLEEEEEEPRRSKRARKETTFGPDFVTFMIEGEPATFKQAMSSPEAQYWEEAINNEVESILQNHTWELVDLPPGCKPLGHKWIFKRKRKLDGTIEKYKARLVVKGFRQTEGVDYFDTYAPVSRKTSIRIVIALAALFDLEIHQMDVKTAFLNGELEEEIYMEQPEGFVVPGKAHKVCKLVKSLYGLKQAPKQWHEKFDRVMLSNGFRINECDKCVYVKGNEKDYVVVCLYVDDMIIIGSIDNINSTKKMLSQKFEMKDLGVADVILGMKITKTSDGYALSQTHYVRQMLDKFDKDSRATSRTPIEISTTLKKNFGESVRQLEYSRIIGSLMYVMNCTRPDIANSVSRLSRYTSNPNEEHWKAIMRLLRYMRYTADRGLHYTRYPAVLEGYSDANWISDSNSTRSTSGYVFVMGGAAVSWRSSKQTCIARSTMESEFIALDLATEEADWLRSFLEGIPMWPKPVPAISMHCDSQSAIGRAQDHMYNGKSRHIRRRHKSVRELLANGVVSLDFVRSKDNIADPFTKGLTQVGVEVSSRGMGLKPIKLETSSEATQPELDSPASGSTGKPNCGGDRTKHSGT